MKTFRTLSRKEKLRALKLVKGLLENGDYCFFLCNKLYSLGYGMDSDALVYLARRYSCQNLFEPHFYEMWKNSLRNSVPLWYAGDKQGRLEFLTTLIERMEKI